MKEYTNRLNKKLLCYMIIMTMILSCFPITSFASSASRDENSPRLNPPVGERNHDSPLDKENTVHVKDLEEFQKNQNDNSLYRPPILEEESYNDVETSSSEGKKYTLGELNKYSYNELVDVLVKIDNFHDVVGLFDFNSDSYEFFKDEKRFQALIDAIAERGAQYTSTDHQGIPMLAEVVRAGYYLGYNHREDLGYLNELSTAEKSIPAILAVQKNPNFRLGTPTQDEVVRATGALIWNSTVNTEIIANAAPVIENYVDNLNTYLSQRSKGDAIFQLMRGIDYSIISYEYKKEIWHKPEVAPWFGKIDTFLLQVERLALLGNVNDKNEWLINNGLYCMGRSGKYHSDSKHGNQVLTRATKIYPYLGAQFFKAAKAIYDNYKGIDYDGKKIDYDELKEEGKKFYTPNKYDFDNGKIVIKAGKQVTEEKIKRLYWAAKEVQAQFYRQYGWDKPLEENHKDDILTIVLYNSPKEYKINYELYNVSTDNGGIYIESWGTFFTYERTPEDSIYTLEELFRHEFTHYLQGRYVEKGLWGDTDFYKNNRLVWYDEGGAEFFAGSTRTSGVKPRKSMVNGISWNTSSRYTLDRLLSSGYNSGFTFYKYAYVFYDYMYTYDKNMFNTLAGYIKNDQVAEYDNYIKSLRGNRELEKAYQKHMQYLYDNRNNYDIPLVSDDYLEAHPSKKSSEIFSTITNVANLSDVTTSENSSKFFKTFTLKGKYVGEASKGRINDDNIMDKKANDFLKELDSRSWSGYKTLTCYFINHRVNSDNNFEYDVVFHGLLPSTSGNSFPIAKINGPYNSKVGEAINFSSEGSDDPDGSIVSYKWDFGDGSTSNDENPSHTYKKEGIFTVKLVVTDNEGATDSATTKATIGENSQPTNSENEPNGNINEANGPIKNLVKVSGTVNYNKEDKLDYYYFNVKLSGEVDITLTSDNLDNINWVVLAESDLNNYAAEARHKDNALKGSFNSQPGKYYLLVYPLSGDVNNYEFSIEGNIDGKVDEEKEPNNSDDTAKPININAVTVGSISSDDYIDTFYFDVEEAGKIDIILEKLNNKNENNINWIVYKKSNPDKYLAYPKYAKPDNLKGDFDAQPGRYYIRVYWLKDKNTNYTLSIKN